MEIKVSEMAEADNLSKLVYLIAQKMELLTAKIEAVYRSDRIYQDNRGLLKGVLQEVSIILNLKEWN